MAPISHDLTQQVNSKVSIAQPFGDGTSRVSLSRVIGGHYDHKKLNNTDLKRDLQYIEHQQKKITCY